MSTWRKMRSSKGSSNDNALKWLFTTKFLITKTIESWRPCYFTDYFRNKRIDFCGFELNIRYWKHCVCNRLSNNCNKTMKQKSFMFGFPRWRISTMDKYHSCATSVEQLWFLLNSFTLNQYMLNFDWLSQSEM